MAEFPDLKCQKNKNVIVIFCIALQVTGHFLRQLEQRKPLCYLPGRIPDASWKSISHYQVNVVSLGLSERLKEKRKSNPKKTK